MKLIVQIPCLNEAKTLPQTIADIPRDIPGVEEVELLVVDDGSTDGTSGIARALGVEHVVRFTNQKGLAQAFYAGIDASLKLGADIVVNTDADNQYRGVDIPRLIEPILAGKADMVVGDREVGRSEHFTPGRRALQRVGSAVVRRASDTTVPDATSGFRAYNREAALQLTIFTEFTYTLETLIQAGRKQVATVSVPVGTNRPLRSSRLFRSTWDYLWRSAVTILRIYAMYKPLRFFGTVGLVFFAAAAALLGRYAYFYFQGEGEGHVQSVVVGGVSLVIAIQCWLVALLADLIAKNRRIGEDALYRVRHVELDVGRATSDESQELVGQFDRRA